MPGTGITLHQMDRRRGPHLFQFQVLHFRELPGVESGGLDMQQPCAGEHDEAAVKMQAGVQIDQQSRHHTLPLDQLLFGTPEQGLVSFAGG